MHFEDSFPRLRGSGYRVTSFADRRYNCFAWAAGRTDVWWEPDRFEIYFWPPNCPRERTLEAFSLAYQALGYAACADGNLEEDAEKIAIYAGADRVSRHAARQLPDGAWSSKLGALEDIQHMLEALESQAYGSVILFMRRKRTASPASK